MDIHLSDSESNTVWWRSAWGCAYAFFFATLVGTDIYFCTNLVRTFGPVQTGLKVRVRLIAGDFIMSMVCSQTWVNVYLCVSIYMDVTALWFTRLRTVVDCRVHLSSVVLRSSQQLAQLARTYTLRMCGVWPDTCSPDVGEHSPGVSSCSWTFYVSSHCPDAVPAGLLIWSNRDWLWRSGDSNTELVVCVVKKETGALWGKKQLRFKMKHFASKKQSSEQSSCIRVS